MEDNKYQYQFEKNVFSKKMTNEVFKVFGLKRARHLRAVYIAILILHQRFTGREFNSYFYCTVQKISDVCWITRKYTAKYIYVLQKLGLIYRIINPSKKQIENDKGLTELCEKFESRQNKKTSFIKVFMLTDHVLSMAVSKAQETNTWIREQYQAEYTDKKAKLQIKKLEATMSKEEIDGIKAQGLKA